MKKHELLPCHHEINKNEKSLVSGSSTMKRNLHEEVAKHFIRLSRLPVRRKPFIKNAYYEQFKLIFVTLNLFGRTALKRTEKGMTWRFVSIRMLYCVATYLVQTYMAVLICLKRFRNALAPGSSYDEIIFNFLVVVYASIHFHVPFTFWRQGPKLAEYINLWAEFQEQWEIVFNKELRLKQKRKVVVLIIVTPLSIGALLALETYSTLKDPIYCLAPHFFCLVTTVLVLGLWYMTSLEIGSIAKEMTRLLVQELETRPDGEYVRNWRRLWVLLCDLTSATGSHWSAVIISILLTYALTFILGLYIALSQFINLEMSFKTGGFLAAGLVSLLIIFTLCDAGYQATCNVTFASHLLLSARLQHISEGTRYEMNLTLNCVMKDHPTIELGGFVAMNRTLFISFVSNTITYLIVLLQFRA